MNADEVHSPFADDRWATRRVLAVLYGLDPAAWTRMDAVGEPERRPLLTIDELRGGVEP